jgi:hypothetical protein
MELQLAEAAVVARERPSEAPYYIDGVPVESLFEEIYDSARELAESRGVKLRFEVVAWDPLYVAADRRALRDILLDLTTRAIQTAYEGSVRLRAFPSHDDVCVTFQIVGDETGSQNVTELNDWNDSVVSSRAHIARMGGELMTLRRAQEGACIWFWLPQWVFGELEYASAAWRKAA